MVVMVHDDIDMPQESCHLSSWRFDNFDPPNNANIGSNRQAKGKLGR